MENQNAKRKHFFIPKPLLERIEQYQKEKGHTTFTSAVLELIRKSLDAEEKKKEEKS